MRILEGFLGDLNVALYLVVLEGQNERVRIILSLHANGGELGRFDRSSIH